MENARTTIWVMAVVLCVASSPVLGVIDIADGYTHYITYAINDNVWVDHLAPGMQTTVNLLDGGNITYYLDAFEDSEINILGGTIGVYMNAWDSSQVDISGGSIGSNLWVYDNSQVDISGGSIAGWLQASNSSQVDISGGSIGLQLFAIGSSQVDISGGSVGGALFADPAGILTIHGSDFVVDGAPFGYGELTSILGGSWLDEPDRHLYGTLASGEPIDNAFYIGHDGKIVLIPAPGAVVLGSIGLGFVGWLRRRRTL